MTILVTSTTCTTRMCIEYDYMHMHVRLYFVVNTMCTTLKKYLCLDLFVIVVKLCTCSTCHGTFISLDINTY